MDREIFSSDHTVKPRRPKSREVSSRFLSLSSPTPSAESQIRSPIHNPKSHTDSRKQKCAENLKNRSANGVPPSSSQSPAKVTIENEKQSTKENHRPRFGPPARYAGKPRVSERSSTSQLKSSSRNSAAKHGDLLTGRLSADENAIDRSSLRQKSQSVGETEESETEYSNICSGASLNSPASLRKSGKEIESKYLSESSSKYRRWSSGNDDTRKRENRRRNSTTKWAMSSGRTASPPMTVETMERPQSFSSLINMGVELFKTRNSSSSSNTCCSSWSPLRTTGNNNNNNVESVHQLRILQSKLVQWRYANAKADVVHINITAHAESNLLRALDSIGRLQLHVLQKRLQFEKEKLEKKLNFMVNSQIKPLENWENMERQHIFAISTMKNCLYSAVCKVPLVEGAKVELQQNSTVLRHALDLAMSIQSMLSTFSVSAENKASTLSKLAQIVVQEKALLEEFFELFRTISTLVIQERSLRCSVMQWRLGQQQHLHKEEEEPSTMSL